MESKQHGKGKEEDKPAGEIMKEPLCCGLASPLSEYAGHPDSETIYRNCDWNRRYCKNTLLPPYFLKEKGKDHTQGKQRQNISKAAASIHHMELRNAEIDYVAFDIGRYAADSQHKLAHSRGNGSQWLTNPYVDNSRQGYHEENQRQWEKEDPENSASKA
jgi:hypothetical protein